jgi:HipA-like protein
MVMRKGLVYNNGRLAGTITKTREGRYIFRYDDLYFFDQEAKAISLTFPKTQQEYESPYLFSFFFNMLSEGSNKALQCRTFQIDEEDYFSLLLKTAGHDTIGAITVKEE